MTTIESLLALGSLVPNLPFGDWQFWVTTAVVAGAAVWIVRSTILPIFTSRRRKRTRVTLTMNGEPVKK